MKIQALGIHGCFVIEHDVFPDERGLFREWFKASALKELGINFEIAQANFSVSNQGVIRGLHYSLAPEGQSKLVTCVQGRILDHLVDIRVGSPTYLEKVSVGLDSNSGISLFIATGVAHGFSVPKETSAISYLTSSEFSSYYEKGINPLDKTLNIDWSLPGSTKSVMSKADLDAKDYEFALLNNLLPTYTKRKISNV
jgi:dTDP-4-dehydrorhamnose 3,5-epimerase